MASNSTIVAELNRLAGITARANFLDVAGAANLWAGTTGLEVVHALNVKAANAFADYKDFLGVVNQLAGTNGLGAAEALSRIP